MKKTKNLYSKMTLAVMAILLFTAVGCERELSEDAIFAEYPRNGDVFIDAFSPGLNYFPFIGDGAVADAFKVDPDEVFSGSASMRFDVPPFGTGFVGATFNTASSRNLTGFDALTFYAKASQAATINDIGFGIDGETNDRYRVARTNLQLTTDWKKYVIPIPDASRLFSEKGLLWLTEGASTPTDEGGYTFWLDEVKFENTGTVAQSRPSILNGEDQEEVAFLDNAIQLTGLTQTYNVETGENVTVDVAPAYFDFESTDIEVARVSELGVVSVIDRGTAVISAFIAGVRAQGSLTLDTTEDFTFAPTPTRDPNNVISIFSDAYTNVPIDFYNGFWEPFQTTESADFAVNGDNILAYTNFNFVGNQFASPTVDVTNTPNLHLNMFIPADIPADLDFLITIVDFGPDGVEGGVDDTRQQEFFFAADFVANTWATLEMPITLSNRSNIGLIIYENINNPTTSSIESFYLDNIYFYQE